ncbi:MAG: SagB/ThcOx family dehydrogenase [Candidatus Bipolaricaulia bacterium]
MNNQDIQATWHYHDGTKHPNGHLLDPRHFYDPTQRPLLFKVYSDLEPIPLPLDKSPLGVPALAAISNNVPPAREERRPGLSTLARILYFSAGITKHIQFPPPWGKLPFRAAACTGALYHIELYLVCGDLPGLDAGVYHFDPRAMALRRLRQGDHRYILIEASGRESDIAQAPAILVLTDVFWRNAFKYQAREYRHAFWDSGTILANTLAITAAHRLFAKVVVGFMDETVSRLLDLDPMRELALALVPIGSAPNAPISPTPPIGPLDLETLSISDHEIDYPAIRAMHEASSLADANAVVAWRSAAPHTVQPDPPAGQLVPLRPLTNAELPSDPLESVIVRRGSTRRFAREAITFRQLSTTLHRALQGIPADFLEPPGTTLNNVYLIANAVDGLAPGAYVFRRDDQALERLKAGDFRTIAGHLGLNQDLAADASVDVFFLTDLQPILERFGNRGYRVAQLNASIPAGRIYLATYAQRFGATGLTFFDDAVTDFFSPHARGKSVMFLIALGKRAKRT